MKSFKEQLIEKVEAEIINYDISDHMKKIKNKMEKYAHKREFLISLIQPRLNAGFAIGNNFNNSYLTFIPDEIEPYIYMKLFIIALKELGFKDEDIEKGAGKEKEFYYYTIKIKW